MEIIKGFLRKFLGPIYNPLKDLYYKLVYLLFKTFKSKKGILIYIGINTGESFERMYYKYETVIGFEPNHENFKKLEKYNQIKDVFLYPYAVSDNSGVGFLHLPSNKNNAAAASLSDFTSAREGIFSVDKVKVKIVSLNEILKKHKINFIDMYISDIEGYDFKVLSSMSEYINKKRIGKIQVEAFQNHVKNPYKSVSNYEKQFDELLRENYDKVGRGWGVLKNGVFHSDRSDHFSIDLLYELK